MNTKTMTSEEQRDYDNYRDAKTTKTQRNVAETNDRVKRTLTLPQFVLGMLVTSVVTALLASIMQWNVGYGVAKFFGVLNNDTPSGSEMYQSINKQNEKTDRQQETAKQYHAIQNGIIIAKTEQNRKLEADNLALSNENTILKQQNKKLNASYNQQAGRLGDYKNMYNDLVSYFEKTEKHASHSKKSTTN